jgi:small GTP-binding protein
MVFNNQFFNNGIISDPYGRKDPLWELSDPNGALINEILRGLINKMKTKIAIVGFGESGKSTLFNKIFGSNIREISTQTTLSSENQASEKFGIIFTDNPDNVTRIFHIDIIEEAIEQQNLIIQCIDGTSATSDSDKNLYDFLKEFGKPIIVVVTKADVMFEDREIREYEESILKKFGSSINPIFISAKTGKNMSMLIERILKLLPNVAKNDFIAKEKINLEIKEKRAREIMYIAAAAAAAAAISPIPVSDIAIITPIQITMVLTIAWLYVGEITFERAKELLAVVGGGVALRYAYQAIVSFLPVVGQIVGPVIAFGSTIALGEAAILYFKSGGKVTKEEINEAYKRAKEKAEKEFKNSDIMDNIKKDQIKKLKEKLSKKEISQEEFESEITKLV